MAMGLLPQLDSGIVGLVVNLLLGFLLAFPLLFIFFRARHYPKSILWKAVYVPRTWWPPDPSGRPHESFDALPERSIFKSILLVCSGYSFHLIHPNQSSIEPDRLLNLKLFTDEEIHLRFLALCFRLSLLGLLFGIPVCLTLFISHVPLTPPVIRTSILENLTVLRLIYNYDLDPSRYTTKLNIWAIFSLVVGSVLAFILIFFEWIFLNSHLHRFSHSKCGDLQIIFLPANPHSGLNQIGEKEMLEWVKACQLGPLSDAEEGKEDTLAQARARYPQKKSNQKTRQRYQRSDSGYGSYSNLDANPQNESTKSSQLELFIHGVFTISNLDQLCSLSERRREVLDQLELAEAKYVAGFIPEEDQPCQSSKHRKGKKPARHEADSESLTPYGPSNFYKLNSWTPEPRMLKMDWESPTIKINWGSLDQTDDQPNLADELEAPLSSAPPGPKFHEVEQDFDLTNAGYRAKWAIGNQIEVEADGTLCSLPPPSPVRPPSQNLAPYTSGTDLLKDSQPFKNPYGSSTVLLPRPASPVLSGRVSPWSLISTDETHVNRPPWTAPTSANPDHALLNASQKNLIFDRHLHPHDFYNKPKCVSLSIPDKVGHHQRSSIGSVTALLLEPSPISIVTPGSQNKRNSDTISDSVVPALFEIPKSLRLTAPNLPVQVPSACPPQIPTRAPTPTPNPIILHTMSFPGQRALRPHRFMRSEDIKDLYRSIRQYRSKLKRLNSDFIYARSQAIREMEDGAEGAIRGWIIVGKGVELIKGAQNVIGMTRDDIRWEGLGKRGMSGLGLFWACVIVLMLIDGILLIPIAFLITTASPEIVRYSSPLRPLRTNGDLVLGLISVTLPSVLVGLLLFGTLSTISYLARRYSGLPSRASEHLLSLKATVVVVVGCFTGWLTSMACVANSVYQIGHSVGVTNQLSNSFSAASTFFLSLLGLLAMVVPAVVIGQPRRWRAIKIALNSPQTPRQRVKSLWPEDMDGLLSRSSALIFESVSLVFFPVAPLMALPGGFFFLILILAQHRNIRSLYRRSSQSGGRTELTMVSMLGLAPCLQSALIGFILASRDQYVLAGIAGLISLFILGASLGLMTWNSRYRRRRRREELDPRTKRSLEVFERGPEDQKKAVFKQKTFSENHCSSQSSYIDLIPGVTLDSPLKTSSSGRRQVVVPLPSETVDDVVETRLALRTYPDAPPHLPDLPWKERNDSLGREMLLLYPPILMQSHNPMVWLPKDGVAKEEAKDLMKYWDLEAVYEEGMSTRDLNLRRQ